MDRTAVMAAVAGVENALTPLVGLQGQLMAGADDPGSAGRDEGRAAAELVTAYLVAARQFCKRLLAMLE